MQPYQQRFLELALHSGALSFGEFTLKSGRVSPYFFNAGLFNTGAALDILGECYADKIIEADIAFDMLFGPAYKGIPLVAVTAAALAKKHGCDVPFAFNRKEAKDHGEGGALVGAELSGRVVIVDDVMTAGTAVREAIALVQAHHASPAAVVIGLDRKERGADTLSAVQSFERDYSLPVESSSAIEHWLEFLSNNQTNTDAALSATHLDKLRTYWSKYGAA